MTNTCTTGTCMLMCPQSEMDMRQRESLVHVLETRHGRASGKGQHIIADRHRMVKMFSRSAAGRNMLSPQDLRPPPILKRTLNYLLSIVVSEVGVPWSTVYSFISDRLRAVRQDMVIQQPPPADCCSILEPIVRFHTYAAYRLCEEPFDVFDPHLNRTHLNESLKQLLLCYDEEAKERNVEGIDLGGSRDQMEALYGLLHLGSVDALYRMLSLAPPQDSLTSLSLRMSLAYFRNDYATVCRLLHHLPVLLVIVTAQHLPQVRRRALLVMNSAYSSKNLCFPLAHLSAILNYNNASEAEKECHHYGLRVDKTAVHFNKGSFDTSVKECFPKKTLFIDDYLANIPLPELLLTNGHPDE